MKGKKGRSPKPDEEILKEAENERKKKRRNTNFVQFYKDAFRKRLMPKAQGSARLWLLLAEHIDPGVGAVVVQQQLLAELLQVDVRTIRRWEKELEDDDGLVKIPVAGRLCAYALNPQEVWRGYDTAKPYAAFLTKTLVRKTEEIERRLTMMLKKQNEPIKPDPNLLILDGQGIIF